MRDLTQGSITRHLLGMAAFNTLVYLGLASTTAVNGLLLQSVMPLLIILFAFAAFGERVRENLQARLGRHMALVELIGMNRGCCA